MPIDAGSGLRGLPHAGGTLDFRGGMDAEEGPGSGLAYDYVRQVLGKPARHGEPPAGAARPEPAATPAPPTVRRQPRSTWERIVVHPDIELHVRRPLARADQRRLDALLEQAQRLFSTEP